MQTNYQQVISCDYLTKQRTRAGSCFALINEKKISIERLKCLEIIEQNHKSTKINQS